MNKILLVFKYVALVVLFSVPGLTTGLAQTDVVFPSDAGVYNVKNYGALGNGTNDDTAAFQAAIKAALNAGGSGPSSGRYSDIVILYIPNGTYILSNTLHNWDGDTSFSGGWIAGLYLQGQSQSATILKLQNSCPGYTSASSPKAVIQTGSENSSAGSNEAVSSITYSGTTATATCTAHGYETGQVVTITGATPSQYNGSFDVTVTGTNTFTYTMTSSPGANASGTIESYAYTGQGNQAFRHYIRNLTIDVGTGNAGAVGIDFLANNRGGIYNVTIKSSDPGLIGYTGLLMDRSYPGPGIVKNVTVTGFTTGISMRTAAEYGMTFDNITLKSQLGDGMLINENTASIYNLTSANSVPVIDMTTTTAHLVLVNGTFTGGVSGNNAITGSGSVYCRNVASTGYGYVINNTNGNNVVGGSGKVTVAEYESTATYKGFSDDIGGSMQIPIEETPDWEDTTLTDWENAATAATVTNSDYTNSIQTAINSGKPVVYLPQGSYGVSNTIHLSGSVQKFIGCCAYLYPLSGFPAGAPLIEFNGGSAPFTDIQNIRIDGTVEHNSAQDLVLENDDVSGGYSNTSLGSGALYAEDLISGTMSINYPQYVWSRQLDIEGETQTFVTNKGGAAWLFGFKTENNVPGGSIIDNTNDGWTELLGGFFYITASTSPTNAMIINNGGSLSANYMMDAYAYPKNFKENIQDTEGTTTTNFINTNCALYSGATTLFPVPEEMCDYTFASSSRTSTNTNTNVTASNFLNGSGYTTSNTTFTPTQIQIHAAGVSGDTAAQDYAASQYFYYTVTANSGKKLYLASLDITVQRSQSSPDFCTVYAIPNGGPSSGQLLTVLDNVTVVGNTNTLYEGDLTGADFQGINSVTVYVIFDGANQGVSTAIDDLGPVTMWGMAH